MTAYSHKLRLKYSAAQMFDLVVDVERYPEFMPWTITTRVRRRTDRVIWTDFTIGTGFIRKQFSTVATLERPHTVAITSQDPLFKIFEQKWTFEESAEGGTDVEYYTEFQFRSFLLQALFDVSFAERATAIVSAYTRRAHRLYGASSP